GRHGRVGRRGDACRRRGGARAGLARGDRPRARARRGRHGARAPAAVRRARRGEQRRVRPGSRPDRVDRMSATPTVAGGRAALDRGRLYGLGAPRRAAASLVTEPVVRLTAGLAFGALLGESGAAAGVVMAGWAALAVARPPAMRRSTGVGDPGRTAGITVLAFLLLAIVQNQDVVAAGALLGPGEAGRFAVL